MHCRRSSRVQEGACQGPDCGSPAGLRPEDAEGGFFFATMVAPSPRVPIKEDAGQDGRASVPSSRHTASPLRPVLGLFLALADGTLLAQPGVPTRLAGLFVMSPLP